VINHRLILRIRAKVVGNGLHFVKAINAIIAVSLQKSKQAHGYRGKTWCLPWFLSEYRAEFLVALAEWAPMNSDVASTKTSSRCVRLQPCVYVNCSRFSAPNEPSCRQWMWFYILAARVFSAFL